MTILLSYLRSKKSAAINLYPRRNRNTRDKSVRMLASPNCTQSVLDNLQLKRNLRRDAILEIGHVNVCRCAVLDLEVQVFDDLFQHFASVAEYC